MGLETIVGRDKRRRERRELEDVEEGRGSKDVADMLGLQLNSSCQLVFLSKTALLTYDWKEPIGRKRKQQIEEYKMEEQPASHQMVSHIRIGLQRFTHLRYLNEVRFTL